MYCHKCGAQAGEGGAICPSCGAQLLTAATARPPGSIAASLLSAFQSQPEGAEARFAVLRTMANVFKLVAWAILALGGISSLVALVAGSSGRSGNALAAFGLFVAGLILSGVYFLFLYAVGEGIYLFLAIEENTRQTSALLKGQNLQRKQG